MSALPKLADQTPGTRGDTRLNAVFSALSDPIRRAILGQLDGHDRLVSEIAEAFTISLAAGIVAVYAGFVVASSGRRPASGGVDGSARRTSLPARVRR